MTLKEVLEPLLHNRYDPNHYADFQKLESDLTQLIELAFRAGYDYGWVRGTNRKSEMSITSWQKHKAEFLGNEKPRQGLKGESNSTGVSEGN